MGNGAEYGQGQGTLSQASHKVADARGDFTRLSESMSSKLSSLNNQWRGQGATSFWKLHQEWDEKQRTIVRALDQFAESLQGTERKNNQTDEGESAAMNTVTQAASNIQTKLG